MILYYYSSLLGSLQGIPVSPIPSAIALLCRQVLRILTGFLTKKSVANDEMFLPSALYLGPTTNDQLSTDHFEATDFQSFLLSGFSSAKRL